MSSYLDVYFSRINHMGETVAERIKNEGRRSFEQWLSESPHTVTDLSVERGIYFSGILLTHQDKEMRKLLKLNVAVDIPLQVGDIMNWRQDDGTIEKWLLLSEQKKVNGNHRVFEIIRCNYIIKWIDSNGHLQSSWCYTVSSVDSMIKGNFRTWHNLITPQPNKYAEIIMPRREIERGTNFIIEDEGWKLVEYDYTSVPGVIYLSLTEGKINLIYDDLVNDIADTDKLALYYLDIPNTPQRYSIGSIIKPVYTLMKNGKPYAAEIVWESTNKQIVKKTTEGLLAVGEGEVELIGTLVEHPEITKSINIIIGQDPQEFGAYIEGNDSIRLDRYETYCLIGTSTIENVSYTLEDTQLATISEITPDNKCIIHANNKNKLGEITLIAEYNGQSYNKVIKIAPLW